MHRAKIAYINRLSSVLNLGFEMMPEKGSGQSPRNAFVKKNWDNGALVWLEKEEDDVAAGEQEGNASDDVLPGKWGIVPQRLLVAYGPRYIGQGMTAEMRDGRLQVSCPDKGMDDPHAVGDDRLMVAVYRPAVPTMHLYPGPLREACKECSNCQRMLRATRMRCSFMHGLEPPHTTTREKERLPCVQDRQARVCILAASTYSAVSGQAGTLQRPAIL